MKSESDDLISAINDLRDTTREFRVRCDPAEFSAVRTVFQHVENVSRQLARVRPDMSEMISLKLHRTRVLMDRLEDASRSFLSKEKSLNLYEGRDWKKYKAANQVRIEAADKLDSYLREFAQWLFFR